MAPRRRWQRGGGSGPGKGGLSCPRSHLGHRWCDAAAAAPAASAAPAGRQEQARAAVAQRDQQLVEIGHQLQAAHAQLQEPGQNSFRLPSPSRW